MVNKYIIGKLQHSLIFFKLFFSYMKNPKLIFIFKIRESNDIIKKRRKKMWSDRSNISSMCTLFFISQIYVTPTLKKLISDKITRSI